MNKKYDANVFYCSGKVVKFMDRNWKCEKDSENGRPHTKNWGSNSDSSIIDDGKYPLYEFWLHRYVYSIPTECRSRYAFSTIIITHFFYASRELQSEEVSPSCIETATKTESFYKKSTPPRRTKYVVICGYILLTFTHRGGDRDFHSLYPLSTRSPFYHIHRFFRRYIGEYSDLW